MPDSISHRQDRQAKRRCDPDKPDAEIDIRVVRRQTLRGQHRAAAEADAARTELAFFGRPKSREEAVVLGHLFFAFFGGFREAAVAGQADQGEQA